ncbi:MAG: hypothetical protein K0R54_25 [Clostridiaceae bacterium]|jgi:hypothetical protein|nr:hypothetical protein [Clostridiaceae bacterium]
MELLKEFAKVGKDVLKQLSNYITVKEENLILQKVFNYKKEKNFDKCPNDCIYNIQRKTNLNNFDTLYCDNYCELSISSETNLTENSEANNQISYKQINSSKYSNQKIRLSKLQIKLFLLYHFCQVSEKGFVLNINEIELAKALKCSLKSIRNSNNRLHDLHLVGLSQTRNHTFSLKIIGYEKYHDDKSKGGTGYVNMPVEQFRIFLEVDDVNALRIQLKQLLKTDYDCFVKKEISTYKYKDIRNGLPRYISNCNVKKLVQNNQSTFETIIKDNGIEFRLLNAFNGKLLKEEKENNYRTRFDKLLTDKGIKKAELFIFNNDLVSLSFEYGFNIVEQNVKEIFTKFNISEIDNFGGFVRQYIRNYHIDRLVA